jgi:hypothetical protein
MKKSNNNNNSKQKTGGRKRRKIMIKCKFLKEKNWFFLRMRKKKTRKKV